MKKVFKGLISIVLLGAMLLSVSSCGIISAVVDEVLGSSGESEADFYNLTLETKGLIDSLADDIYTNWYDSIYNGKFDEDIDKAIDAAFEEHADDVDKILENTDEINELYKDVKDGYLADEAKAVMQAYNEYYSLVIEISGSFNDYSESKEKIKKELSSALKNYSSEY